METIPQAACRVRLSGSLVLDRDYDVYLVSNDNLRALFVRGIKLSTVVEGAPVTLVGLLTLEDYEIPALTV